MSLVGLGWQVQQVGTVFAALTTLEWSRPDIVLVRHGAKGLAIGHVSTILRRALVDTETVLVLVAMEAVPGGDPSGFDGDPAGFDLLIESQRPSVITASLEQLPQFATVGEAASKPGPAPPARGEEPLVDELLSSFAAALTTGRLVVHVPGDEPPFVLLFDQGRIIHVAQGREEGMALLATLLQVDLDVPHEPGLWYRFENVSSEEIDRCTRSIQPVGLDALRELAGAVDDFETQELKVPIVRQRRTS